VFIILAHERRRIVHCNVTEHPTAQWTAPQIIEAFPGDTAPRDLRRDRDAIYGQHVQQRIPNIGIEEVQMAPCSPWQHPYCERVIGSIRRDVLDHVVVLHARHLMRLLTAYLSYYHRFRTHLSLAMDCPIPRAVERPAYGPVRVSLEGRGLQHHYERIAA
jgi:transposase InsO family protein